MNLRIVIVKLEGCSLSLGRESFLGDYWTVEYFEDYFRPNIELKDHSWKMKVGFQTK